MSIVFPDKLHFDHFAEHDDIIRAIEVCTLDRRQAPIVLIVMCMDDVQELLAKYGKDATKKLMKWVALQADRYVRRDDVVGYLAPNHVACLCYEVEPEKGLEIAERIHQGVMHDQPDASFTEGFLWPMKQKYFGIYLNPPYGNGTVDIIEGSNERLKLAGNGPPVNLARRLRLLDKRITLSIGIAERLGGESAKDWIDRALAAAGKAVERGGNCVQTCWPERAKLPDTSTSGNTDTGETTQGIPENTDHAEPVAEDITDVLPADGRYQLTPDMVDRLYTIDGNGRYPCFSCDLRYHNDNLYFCLSCGEPCCCRCIHKRRKQVDTYDNQAHFTCKCGFFLKSWEDWYEQARKMFPEKFVIRDCSSPDKEIESDMKREQSELEIQENGAVREKDNSGKSHLDAAIHELPGDHESRIAAIGLSFFRERDINSLTESILRVAMEVSRADSGVLYLLDAENQSLQIECLRIKSQNVFLGGANGKPVSLAPVMILKNGKANDSVALVHVAVNNVTLNIGDISSPECKFAFSRTGKFDERVRYLTASILVVPVRNSGGEVIAVLQLMNALNPDGGKPIAFSEHTRFLVESLAEQAGTALCNLTEYRQQVELFESMASTIGTLIDDKHLCNNAHCARVPPLTMMIANALNRNVQGPLKDFNLSEAALYELKLAAQLHDIGKIPISDRYTEKQSRLSGNFDRIEIINHRFDILERDAEISMLRAGYSEQSQAEFVKYVEQLRAEREFLRSCNDGVIEMNEEHQQRIKDIAARTYRNELNQPTRFLSDREVECLTIREGMLTEGEVSVVNRHAEITRRVLEYLPWPSHLKNIPEIGGAHHECMDGNGFPLGLTRDQMSLQARILALADAFEELTSPDSCGRHGLLSEALRKFEALKNSGRIDPDLYELFMRERVYLEFAKQHLPHECIDCGYAANGTEYNKQPCTGQDRRRPEPHGVSAGNRWESNQHLKDCLLAVAREQMEGAKEKQKDAWYWGSVGDLEAMAVSDIRRNIEDIPMDQPLQYYRAEMEQRFDRLIEAFRRNDSSDSDGYALGTLYAILRGAGWSL